MSRRDGASGLQARTKGDKRRLRKQVQAENRGKATSRPDAAERASER